MEFMPTITCEGDYDIFFPFKDDIQRRLSDTTIEWKRSHGRPSKMVVVRGQCLRLTKDHLKYTIETTPSLNDLPFFHMFWTDCQDFDEYRSEVKDRINKWLRNIKSNSNNDWLVVQVITHGSLKGNKPKLQLPRSSVFDKIKSDFGGGKANDRCIQLWEPSKHEVTPRSVESWQAFMNKLRQAILATVDRNLRKFEDKVRNTRDKRNEAKWDFTKYFLCHEEVAMVYEMMHLNEEALIHYDEIDALMHQLVNNVKTSDYSGPLTPFTGECWCWDGASISSDSEKKLRAKIKERNATLLDIRNYLFIRQCALLFQLDRVKDVLQRMLEFMHNVVHELTILNVSIPAGASACWVTLSSLQLIRSTIQKNPELVTYSLHTAQIYQYAMKKLFEVGHLCGLMPDEVSTDQQLHLACELSGGVGKNDEVKFSEGNPSNKLKTALSSKDGFKALYLELLQMAIKTYENIKRTRSAKVLGIDLGRFYMSGGSFGDAEELLTEGYKMFAEEGWGLLAANTLLCLAQCQYQLRNMEKYAQSCAVLACQSHLKKNETLFFTEELIRLKDDKEHDDKPLVIRAEPLFKPEMVKIHLTKNIATVGETVHIEIQLDSGLERVVDDCLLRTTMRMSVAPQDSEPIRLSNEEDSVDSSSVSNASVSSSSSDGVSSSGGDEKVKEKFILDSEKVQLTAGKHIYCLKGKVRKSGTYLLQQLLVRMGNIQLLASLQRLPKKSRKFVVVSESPTVTWTPGALDIPLVAGLPNCVSLTIATGPAAILDQSVLQMSSESGLLFQPMECRQAVITSQSDEKSTDAEYSITLLDEVKDENLVEMSSRCLVKLPLIPPYHKIQIDLLLYSQFDDADVEQLTVDHDALSCATWSSTSQLTSLFLTFNKPFLFEHVLFRTKYGQFLQVILTGATCAEILICNAELERESKLDLDVTELIPLNTSTPQVLYYQGELSYVWRMNKGLPDVSTFVLSLAYSSRIEAGDRYTFKHTFKV
ncbi:trafficking protein particle complex subunit 10-like [Dendronephthya gigantea]|uniref:trafficking protein particle complex subunit 10-like n=1 Tax=Dendronephthya gigantea TaxID=151771 RepID=UPI001068F249|nr:trafficking protein particle complex subunit 10-like [Dendronephthya gigantea]